MKKVIVFSLVTVFLSAIWYFGHHRPAQKILKAEPKKVYKTVTPIANQKTTVAQQPTVSTMQVVPPTDTAPIETADLHSDTTLMNNTFEKPAAETDAETPNGSTSVQAATLDTDEALDPDTQWLIEESDRILAEMPALKAEIAEIQARADQLKARKTPELVRGLQSMPMEEQVALLVEVKDMLMNRSGLIGLVLKDVATPRELQETAWQRYLDNLVTYGYTLPPGIE